MTRAMGAAQASDRGRLLDLAVAAGLVEARALRAEGWIVKQRCPSGCDQQARRGACNYSADGRRFRCHRCGLGGGQRVWLTVRGETVAHWQGTPRVPVRRRLNQRWPVAAGWAALQARPGRWRDAVAEWATTARGWPDDIVRALVGRGLQPPIDDIAAFCTGQLPREAVPLLERARRLNRKIMIAQRDAAGRVRTLRFRWHRDGPPGDGAQKTLALPQWASGPSSTWGTSLFGRLAQVQAAAQKARPIVIVEGGPDYLVAAALTRLGVIGAALGVASCGEVRRLAPLLRQALDGCRATVLLVPHRGDQRDVGERAMRSLAERLDAHRVRRVHVPVDGQGRGDLADAAAQVRSARVLAALLESAQ